MEQEEASPDLRPESRSIRAFPRSAESSMWDGSPFRQIPKTPFIMRHGPPIEAPPARQEGPDEDLTPPMQHNPSRSASRAPSRSSRRSRSSSTVSGPYGVIDAVAVPPSPVMDVPSASSAPSRASSVSSRPKRGTLSRAASASNANSRPPSISPSETTTRLDPVFPSRQSSVSAPPTRPVSVATTRSGPSRPHSRDPSLIPDNSIDQPVERQEELPPQGGAAIWSHAATTV